MDNPDISIVTGTYNRCHLLQDAVRTARAACGALSVEIIIIDAGSTDGTRVFCESQPDVVYIDQGELLGAIKAFNAGFSIAKGKYVINLNDDCIVNGLCFENAARMLDNDLTVGQIAFPFSDPGKQFKASAHGARRYMYANFGMTRKWLGDLVGWWGDVYRKYGGDTIISMRIQMWGYKIGMIQECAISHYRTVDSLRLHEPRNVDQFIMRKEYAFFDFSMPQYPLITEEEYLALSDIHKRQLRSLYAVHT